MNSVKLSSRVVPVYSSTCRVWKYFHNHSWPHQFSWLPIFFNFYKFDGLVWLKIVFPWIITEWTPSCELTSSSLIVQQLLFSFAMGQFVFSVSVKGTSLHINFLLCKMKIFSPVFSFNLQYCIIRKFFLMESNVSFLFPFMASTHHVMLKTLAQSYKDIFYIFF